MITLTPEALAALRNGKFIPPEEGEPVCSEYDPAGIGAMDADGSPQCAMCGWPKSFHGVKP